MSNIYRLLDPATIERLDHLSMHARRYVDGNAMGLHRSSLRGASVEFRQRRAYVPGDEPRRVDWRVLARTDRLFVKEYDEETNLRCVVALDASESMAYAGGTISKFDYAAKMAAALAYLMLSRHESVGLATFRQHLDGWIGPRSHGAQLAHVVDVLERTQPSGNANVAAALADLADRVGRRGMIFLLSDWFNPINDIGRGLARLRHGRHEVVMLQIIDDDELNFPFQSVSRFIGLESESPILTEPTLIRDRYLNRFQRHQAALKKLCDSLQVEHFVISSGSPLLDAMERIALLRQRTA